jgi:predicted short-subunit dehydrogenase-like oxidoreductase (DUF2520 family)
VAVTAEDDDTAGIGASVARDLGGRPFPLDEDRRALYHAAAVFCSNYLVAVEAVAERLFAAAGVTEPLAALAPLATASLDNALDRGPIASITGPAVRGDAGTVRRNLEALREGFPEAVPAYVALADVALDLAVRSGRLPEDGRGPVEEVLAGWR